MCFQIPVNFLVVVVCCAVMSGCGAAVVGGAGYAGYKGVTDERTIGTMVDDTLLAATVKSRLISDEFVKARLIDVDALNGVVYLIGVAESDSQRRMAADIARGVEGVLRVENQLVVGQTSAGRIVDDTVLSSRIRAELIKTPDIRSTNIDVDTNNNRVTLTGIVSSDAEKARVLDVVQRISGNRQIIDNLAVKN